jgi:TonB family protein
MRRLTLFLALLAVSAASVLAQDVFDPGNGVSLPTVVNQVRTDYSDAVRAAGIEGDVAMQAVVLADGTVGDVNVTRSLDSVYGLDDQAVSALKQWQFQPGTKDGKRVAVRVNVQTRFTLK